MKLRHHFFFLRRNLRRRPGRTLTAVFAIAMGIGIFHLVTALALALRSQVLDRIETIFPERAMVVRAKAIELGPIALTPGFLTARLTSQTVERVSRMPEVQAVYPILPLSMPALAVGSLLGYEGSTDIVMYGAPAGLVQADIAGRRGFTYADPTTYSVPVVISRFFMDMFNMGLAEGQGLPRLTDRAVVGRGFNVVLGASMLDTHVSTASLAKIRCEIVGLTRNPSLLAAVVPIEYVRQFNRWYHGPDYKEQYTQLHIMLRSPSDYESAAKQFEAMGLEVEGRRETAQRLKLAVTGAVIVLMLFGLAVLAMALVNIVNTFALIMLERRGELGLLRAVGATRRAATGLLLLESLLIGLAGGLIGSGVAWLLAFFANDLLVRWLPPFSLAPDYWLDERIGLLLFSVLLAAAGSVLATAPLVWRSVRRWPADLLRS
jgi:hypothetical protein